MRDMAELHRPNSLTIGVGNKKITDKIVSYVLSVSDQEFSGLSVSILAHSFNIERSKLSRRFKDQMGITLEDFLHKEKMNRAAFLLRTRDITVKEVSRRIGFCTCDYFIRKFKEYYGIVPGRYKSFKTKSSIHDYHLDRMG